MRKRILSLLLCIVMMLSLLSTVAFAAERPITPVNNSANDMWLTADGMLHWTDTGSSSYTIEIFQHPGSIALKTISAGNVTEYNLYDVMDDEKYEQRDYRIEISDHHDNLIISYVSPYEKLSAPTNLRWNGNVAEWDSVPNADQYRVYLYDSADQYITADTTTGTSYDWSSRSPEDGWYFEVYAIGTDYRNSAISEGPKYGAPASATEYDVTIVDGTSDVSKAAVGDTVTITADTATEGKHFARWSIVMPMGLVLTDGESPTTTFTMPEGNVIVAAIFEQDTTPPVPTTYTVTFNMNGHGTQVADQTVEDGNKATKPAVDPTEEGWTFGGWYTDAACTTAFDFTTPITADTTIYAKWTEILPVPVKHTISYDLNGGTMDGSTGIVTVDIEEGTVITLPAPTREGYY